MAARLLRELEAMCPHFVEEPVLPEHATSLTRLIAASAVPIATGERLFATHEFLGPLLAGIAVAQPDIANVGISEGRRIAAMAETFGASVAPHCAAGPVALAASLQFCFATPNACLQEQPLDAYGDEAIAFLTPTTAFDLVDGMMSRTPAPGLGIEVDENVVASLSSDQQNYETPPRWRPPHWRHRDGSFAEW
jgi:galactonate dehydratase